MKYCSSASLSIATSTSPRPKLATTDFAWTSLRSRSQRPRQRSRSSPSNLHLHPLLQSGFRPKIAIAATTTEVRRARQRLASSISSQITRSRPLTPLTTSSSSADAPLPATTPLQAPRLGSPPGPSIASHILADPHRSPPSLQHRRNAFAEVSSSSPEFANQRLSVVDASRALLYSSDLAVALPCFRLLHRTSPLLRPPSNRRVASSLPLFADDSTSVFY